MLLLFLIFIPFIFGVLSWQSERIGIWVPRWIALFSMGMVLFIALFIWHEVYHVAALSSFMAVNNTSNQWLLEYFHAWIPKFGINFHVALDGLSLIMIILSGYLGCIAVLCSWREVQKRQGVFYLHLLWIMGGVIGVFLSIDMFLFFFFWEIMLIPIYFLISLWGYQASNNMQFNINAATKFFIYTQLSGLFMLVSIISLVSINYHINGVWSFSYQDLLHTTLSKNTEYLLMLGFFFAFAVKMPVVPFHGWLLDAHSCAPTAGSVDLAGILLKTAAYGLFRFNLSLFPYASQSFASIGIFLGLLSIFYGAWMAFTQTDIKRLIACTSISHMGFILLAIYSGNCLSYQGAAMQMVAHSISISGMFVLCGQLYERLHIRDIRMIGGGLWGRMNLIPAFSLCFLAAMFGLPGTGNFIGEITILFGMFQVSPFVAIIAAFSIVFATVYSLRLMQSIYYGPVSEANHKLLKNMTSREKFIILTLLLCLFGLGFFPQSVFNASYITMSNIHNQLQEYRYLM